MSSMLRLCTISLNIIYIRWNWDEIHFCVLMPAKQIYNLALSEYLTTALTFCHIFYKYFYVVPVAIVCPTERKLFHWLQH